MPKTSKSYHSDPRRPHDKPSSKPKEEEPKEDYPSARKRAVREAVKETKRTESGALRMPEMTITGDPRAAEEREERSAQSAELEAAEAALEDQQSRRLQESISSEMWESGIRAAEAVGIPAGLAAAGYRRVTTTAPADPVTAAYKPPKVGDVHRAGYEKADLPSGIKPGGMEGAGTLKGQRRAFSAEQAPAHRRALDPLDRGAELGREAAYESAVEKGTQAERSLSKAGRLGTISEGGPTAIDPITGTRGTRVGHRTHPADWQADAVRYPDYQDPKWRLHAAQADVAADVAAGASPREIKKQAEWLTQGLQQYRNLSTQAEELLRPISKTIGTVAPWAAAAAAVMGFVGVGSAVLSELSKADSEAIPDTMRALARSQEEPLKDFHVASEALEQLTPEDVESLYQDGTISYQLYGQLR